MTKETYIVSSGDWSLTVEALTRELSVMLALNEIGVSQQYGQVIEVQTLEEYTSSNSDEGVLFDTIDELEIAGFDCEPLMPTEWFSEN